MIDRAKLIRWYDFQAPFYRLWRDRYDSPLLQHVLRGLPEGRPVRVLDAACGTGFVSIGLALSRPLARIVGLDASVGMLRVARLQSRRRSLGATEFLAGDVNALPFADQTFDLVVLAGLMPLLAEPEVAIREFRRVLRPCGTVFSLEFDREQLRGRRRLLFNLMIAGYKTLSRLMPRFRYAERWNLESSTIDPEIYAGQLQRGGFSIRSLERRHAHLIYELAGRPAAHAPQRK